MGSAVVAVVVAVLVVVVGALAVRRAGRRGRGGRRPGSPLVEVERFARARETTTRWATDPSSTPDPVRSAPRDAARVAEEPGAAGA